MLWEVGVDRPTMEDAIVTLVKAAVPESTTVGSLPQGTKWEEMFRFRTAAVWVAYAGSTAKGNQIVGGLSQPETWNWSVLVFTRNYRSPSDANGDALALMETVIAALAGTMLGDGRLVKVRDTMIAAPQKTGIVAYEVVFSIQQYLRRTS